MYQPTTQQTVTYIKNAVIEQMNRLNALGLRENKAAEDARKNLAQAIYNLSQVFPVPYPYQS